jgi:hypothetical protein
MKSYILIKRGKRKGQQIPFTWIDMADIEIIEVVQAMIEHVSNTPEIALMNIESRTAHHLALAGLSKEERTRVMAARCCLN